MPGRVLLSIIALGGLANAMVPADPTITAAAVLPRQNNDRFIGWVEFSGSWYSETCNPGLTWYQDGKYGQCCPATLASCYAPTACVSGSLIYPYPDKSTTRTIACTENYGDSSLSICNTAFIFENLSDSAPKTDIVCGPSSVNWSYYRKVPASVTEISSKAPTSIAQPVSTALTAPVGSGTSSGSSKAWIAGAVVGPIVGLGLIGAAIFFILRKRRNNKTAPQQGSAAMASVDPSLPPAGVAGYTDAKPQFAAAPQHQQQQQQFDPYAHQNAYNAQQAYGAEGPTSPAPGYHANTAGGAEYYGGGGDVKQAHGAPPANGAVEMGAGETSAHAAPAAGQAVPAPAAAAELGGGDGSHGAAATQGHVSELPGNTAGAKP